MEIPRTRLGKVELQCLGKSVSVGAREVVRADAGCFPSSHARARVRLIGRAGERRGWMVLALATLATIRMDQHVGVGGLADWRVSGLSGSVVQWIGGTVD